MLFRARQSLLVAKLVFALICYSIDLAVRCMNHEVFEVIAQQLKQMEQFGSDAHLVLCLLGPLFYCAARQLDHIRVMHEME